MPIGIIVFICFCDAVSFCIIVLHVLRDTVIQYYLYFMFLTDKPG